MTQSPTEPGGRREGRVRLRRSGIMAVPALAIAGGLVVLTAQGVIAAQFAISGIPFTVTASNLHGDGFEQWGFLDQTADGSPNLADSNGQEVVVVSAIKSATLHHLCQSVNLGGVYLVLTAGTGSTPVTATNLVVDSDQLTGSNATFTNINVGQDASTMNEVPNIAGPLGDFGQQADAVDIADVRQDNWATTAARFSLPGLNMSFKSTGC